LKKNFADGHYIENIIRASFSGRVAAERITGKNKKMPPFQAMSKKYANVFENRISPRWRSGSYDVYRTPSHHQIIMVTAFQL
jgi:hypothetical protein